MVASKDQAAAAFELGITQFGIDNYGTCGDKAAAEGFLATSACLHAAKKRRLTVANMVAKYRAKA